jgi:endonuclease/exonuclease/phosphatase family metal-dependent hydrolase
MKLVTLNTWGGKIREPLLDFLRTHKDEVDIFCFQEVLNCESSEKFEKEVAHTEHKADRATFYDLYSVLAEVLETHQGYFRPHFKEWYGLAIFVRKGIKVLEEGEHFVFKEKGHIPEGDVGFHARNIQYVAVETPAGLRTVVNFHGLWNGNGKTDTDDRLAQSTKIVEFMKDIETPIILCGDFNLLPDTKSIEVIENTGLRNLVKEHNVTSTRTSFYTKQDKYADYIFTSPQITVKNFSVLPHEVSDHAALLVEFE